MIPQTIGPALIEAEERGEISAWWFMNKQPWRLRGRQPGDPIVWGVLSDLVHTGQVKQWIPAIYEPETAAFGGPAAMDIAHELFYADSRHLQTIPSRPYTSAARKRPCSCPAP